MARGRLAVRGAGEPGCAMRKHINFKGNMTDRRSKIYCLLPVRLYRPAFFLAITLLAGCNSDLPITPEESKFSASGLSLSAPAVNFEPTFIGRSSSDTVSVEYGDTVDIVLHLHLSDTLHFTLVAGKVKADFSSPDSTVVSLSKKVRQLTLTLTYKPQVADQVDLAVLYLETFRWTDSLKTDREPVGVDSVRLAGVGLGYYLDLETIFIPGGVFPMGQDSVASGGSVAFHDEWNEHQVTVSDFFIGRYEVTNLQYYEFWKEVNSGANPGDTTILGHTPRDTSEIGKWPAVALDKPNFPVIGVSWYDALAFCDWLSLRTGERYTLPTEAQWEYVARGGQQREFPWSVTDDSTQAGTDSAGAALILVNVRRGNDGYTFTAPVEAFPSGASAFGPLNMAGNVWEWCFDWYDPDYYRSADSSAVWVDPQGSTDPEHEIFKVIRGGSWLDDLVEARCTNRSAIAPVNREINVGFRVVRLP